MKLGIWLVIVAVASLCSAAVAAAEAGSSAQLAGSELDGGAAREAAQERMRELKRRSKKIDTISANACNRRSSMRVDCGYQAYGETPKRATSCQAKVIVRGSGTVVTSVKLRLACSSRPILSLARAKRAMLAKLRSIAGRPVGLMAIERKSFGEVIGYAEWTQEGQAAEECTADLLAQLSPPAAFSTTARELRCRTAGETSTQPTYFAQYLEGSEAEPAEITIGTGTLGGTFSTTDLTDWRGWGTEWSTATGKVSYRGCLPTCVQGKRFNLPATVVLDRPGSGCGQRRYSRIRIFPTGGPYRVIGPYGVDCDGSLIFY